MKTILGSILLLLLNAATGMAASNAELERLKPFIDPYTVAVVQLNLNELDVAASTAALVELLPEWKEMLAQPIEQARETLEPWHQQFRQAGGERLYILLSLNWLVSPPPIVFVAPLTGNADPERLKAAFAMAGPGWQPQVMHGCVVTAPEPVLHHLQTVAAAVALDGWQAAFEAAPAGIARVVMVPYAESGRVLKDLLPTLPPMLGGGPGSILTRGFHWAVLTLKLPPAGALSLTIQSESAEAAVALRQIMEHGLNALGEVREVRQLIADWDRIEALLLPNASGNRLQCRLEFVQFADVVRGLQPAFDAAIGEARSKAMRAQIVNQLKQIGLGLILHAGDHGDRLPPHLADILKFLGNNPRLLLHPGDAQVLPADFATQSRDAQAAWISAHTPFVYVRPGESLKELKAPMTTVLVYERPKPDDDSNVGVLFADGHVETLPPGKLRNLLDNSGVRSP
jgi:prepilin-type processing-associated H-X9-DG protein